MSGTVPGVLSAWVGVRGWLRGAALPIFALPLLPTAILALIGGNTRAAFGAVAGGASAWLAMRVLRRARSGDIDRAALVLGIGAALSGHLAAGFGPLLAALVGVGSWAGTRMLYAALPESAPPAPPAPPPPPGPLDAFRERVARLRGFARERGQQDLAGAAAAIGGVLDELAARPHRIGTARRFLVVQLDGLDRIAERLAAGAAPPATLAPLLTDLTQAADRLRGDLRREETEALEVQVKVLSDRLRSEGYQA